MALRSLLSRLSFQAVGSTTTSVALNGIGKIMVSSSKSTVYKYFAGTWIRQSP